MSEGSIPLAGGEDTSPVGEAVSSDTGGPPEESSTVGTGGGHPAWGEILAHIPPSLHETVRPALQKWDDGVQQRLSEVQSRYAPFEQFQGAKPEQVSQAMQLFNLLNSDPQQLYTQMGDHFGYSGQGQDDGSFDVGDNSEKEEFADDPRLKELQAQQAQVLSYMEKQQQTQQQQEADAWMDTQQKQAGDFLKAKGIDNPDWDYILNKAAGIGQLNGGDLDAAMKLATQSYAKFYDGVRAAPVANNSAPSVLPTSGGVPSTRVNPGEMDSAARKKYGLELLDALMKET